MNTESRDETQIRALLEDRAAALRARKRVERAKSGGSRRTS